ncbi:hypothetical protein [uncultured Polaribacter sp.]|uniref:hypothetical protein n=1 Tax=uncultured Polaribacter sp. TaxID=174711 RepID=UPI0026124745|nr:hypothetical protein [uncultured Polaribacter sp.]
MKEFLSKIILLIIGILFFIIFDCSGERKRENKLTEFWGQKTSEFFKNIDCNKLTYNPKKIEFDKIFILGNSCKLIQESYYNLNVKQFSVTEGIGNSITKNIEEAEVIIWIKRLENGKKYGNYTNGASAIRLNYEVNLINKKTKNIFKKSTFEGLGTPPKEIKRKLGNNSPQYFGSIPYQQITDFIFFDF